MGDGLIVCEEMEKEFWPNDQKHFFKLNIGGKRYQMSKEAVISHCKSSLLAKFCALSHQERLLYCDAYFDDVQEYYFERPPKESEPLMDFFMTGLLHRPTDLCVNRFYSELEFWLVSKSYLAPCCQRQSLPNGVLIENNETANCNEIAVEVLIDPFEGKYCHMVRRALWNLFENPQSSRLAKICALLSMIFVFVSVAGLILGSMEEFQTFPDNSTDSTNYDEIDSFQEAEPHYILNYAEYMCITWFSLEYITRFVVSPEKWNFFKAPLNLIDLFTILPFGVEVALPLLGIGVDQQGLRKFSGTMLVMRVLRVLRVMRVFKLARYSTGLQAFGDTMKKSLKELSMLSMFLLTGIIFFSTLLYFLEKDEANSKFKSIPAACWWCVVTMTTVGYGDVVPTTTGGKLVATIASVCGIIVLAFPISMIVDKFATAQDVVMAVPQPSVEARNGSFAYDPQRSGSVPSPKKRRLRGFIL